MIPPLLIALLASVCWGCAWFFSARVSRQAGSLNALFLFQLLGVPPLLLLFHWRPALERDPQWLAFFGLAALCCAAMGLFFQAMRIGNLALVTPLSQAAPVVAAVLGVVWLREPISSPQLAGVAGVLAGVLMLAVNRGPTSTRLLVGTPQAVSAALIAGFYLFGCGMVARTSGWFWTSLGIRLGMVFLLGLIVLPKAQVWLRKFPAAFWRDAAVAAVLDVVAFTLYNYAVTQTELWFVAAIVTSQSLVTVLLAAFFLRERLTRRQTVGLVLLLLGLVGVQGWLA